MFSPSLVVIRRWRPSRPTAGLVTSSSGSAGGVVVLFFGGGFWDFGGRPRFFCMTYSGGELMVSDASRLGNKDKDRFLDRPSGRLSS